MNTNRDWDLFLYGLMLAGLGVLAHWKTPEVGPAVLITGIAGGAAAMFWGVLGLRGFRRRIWPVGTLVGLMVALAIQTVRAWVEVEKGNATFKLVAAILTLLCTFGVWQLVSFLRKPSS